MKTLYRDSTVPVDEGEKSEAKASLHVRVQAIEGPGNNSTPPKPITRGNTDLPPAGRALCPLDWQHPQFGSSTTNSEEATGAPWEAGRRPAQGGNKQRQRGGAPAKKEDREAQAQTSETPIFLLSNEIGRKSNIYSANEMPRKF